MDNNRRTRNWTFIVYPNEICLDWEDRLRSSMIKGCYSPVHQPDPENISPEEQRKKHVHVFIAYDSVKTYKQVETDICSIFGDLEHHGFTFPQEVKSTKAIVRYFVHADQPDKQQFEKGLLDISGFCGFKLDDFLVPSTAEKSFYLNQIFDFIQDNEVLDFHVLLDYARSEYYDSWYYILVNGSFFLVKNYIESFRRSVIHDSLKD